MGTIGNLSFRIRSYWKGLAACSRHDIQKNGCDVLIQSANISHQGLRFDELLCHRDTHAAGVSGGGWVHGTLQHHQQATTGGLLIGFHLRRSLEVWFTWIQVHPEKVLTSPLMIAQIIQIAQIRFRKALGSVGYTVGLFYYHYLFHQILHFLSS